MNVEECKKKLTKPLKQATLCFLVRNDEILLAMKKRGFGAGLYNGVGGKQNPGETITEAARREASEEIGVKIGGLNKVADLKFYFSDNPDWGQQVTAFLVEEWEGVPEESEEMAPKWFSKDQIPYKQMWPDDEQWIPLVLQGQKVEAEYVFGGKNEILDYKLKIVE